MANNEWYFLLQNDSYFWFLPKYDTRSTTCTYYVQWTVKCTVVEIIRRIKAIIKNKENLKNWD